MVSTIFDQVFHIFVLYKANKQVAVDLYDDIIFKVFCRVTINILLRKCRKILNKITSVKVDLE